MVRNGEEIVEGPIRNFLTGDHELRHIKAVRREVD